MKERMDSSNKYLTKVKINKDQDLRLAIVQIAEEYACLLNGGSNKAFSKGGFDNTTGLEYGLHQRDTGHKAAAKEREKVLRDVLLILGQGKLIDFVENENYK